MRILFLTILSIAIMGYAADATIINIPADYPTIQQGIDASTNGDTVLVQPGTYVENISIMNKTIVLASNYIFSSDTLDIVNTVIDGDSVQPGYNIYMQSSDSLSRIAGFKFTDENNSGDGAINVTNCDSVIIENNIFEVFLSDFVVHTYGNYYMLIRDNVFRFNDFNINSLIISCSDLPYGTLIKNNVFYNNHDCIMIHFIPNGQIAEDNIFYNNDGQIFWCPLGFGEVFILRNIIFNNYYGTGGWGGGGIFHTEDTEIYIDQNVIYNNTGTSGSYFAVFGIDNGVFPAILANNIIWSNYYPNPDSAFFYDQGVQPTITYSDVQGGWPGEGNIECDPQFCDPGSGNFYLNGNSCCIGAGQNGENMGVYGVGCWSHCDSYVVGDVNGSGAYDGLDIMYGVAFLKGGPPPTIQCECTIGNILFPAGDVNNSCSYNGLDITYGVAYFKGGSTPVPCQDCPPVLDR